MKSFFLFFLLFAASQLSAQLLAPCPISDSLYNELDAQAAQIMLNEMVANGTASDSPVELDSAKHATYLALLFEVRQLENSPDRDLVIDQLNVRPFSFVFTQTVRLAADPNQGWMINLRNGEPSGNNTLDSLMSEYDLEVSRFLLLSSIHIVDLVSTRHLNTPALAEVFESTMDSLNFAEAQNGVGDGNNIEMVPISPSGWIVRYSVGSGDCPAGCIMRDYYDFSLSPFCTEFDIQESGSNSTRLATISPLKVYPTPFTDEIHLPETIIRYSYEILDAMGRRVKPSATDQSGPVSGLGDLVPGWYVLRVQDQTGKIYLTRVVK